MVQIVFDSATYDEVRHDVKVTLWRPFSVSLEDVFVIVPAFFQVGRDVKVTVEAALGLVGGTMGLFTGFSVLSGIEIIFFLAKFVASFTILRKSKRRQAVIKDNRL